MSWILILIYLIKLTSSQKVTNQEYKCKNESIYFSFKIECPLSNDYNNVNHNVNLNVNINDSYYV